MLSFSPQVDVTTHPGWVGQLDRSGKTGSRTLYYADYHKEVQPAFHCSVDQVR